MQDDQQHAQPLPNEPTSVVETTPTPNVPAEIGPSSGSAPAADAVWVSREEYQRLKQAEAAQAKPVAKGPAKLFGGLQVATSALAAVALLLGLMAHGSGALLLTLVPASLIILALMGGFTLLDYRQAKATGQIREHTVRNVVMFVLAIVCFAVPLAFPVFGLIFLLLVCGFGSCGS